MFDTDGPAAEEIAGLWWWMLALGAVVFVVVMPSLVLVIVMALTINSMRGLPATAPSGALKAAVIGPRRSRCSWRGPTPSRRLRRLSTRARPAALAPAGELGRGMSA